MNGTQPIRWGLCGDGVCLFSNRTIPQSGRCIRHGSLIDFIGHQYDGKTRQQVRSSLARIGAA